MVSKSFIDVKPKLSLLGIQRVVVDPGHGGKDPGAIGKKGLKEKDVNLDIAKRLRKLLQTRGVSVVMTRSRDEFISLKKRASIANKANADFFISIHANASRSRNPRGFEIYYLRESSAGLRNSIYAEKFIESDFSQTQLDRSSKYAKAILWDMIYSENRAESVDLSRCILDSMSRQTSLKNRGIKTAGFAVLKNTRIPAILIEVGFLSNLKEERMLNNSFYRQQIAESIAGGIFNHNRQYRVVQR